MASTQSTTPLVPKLWSLEQTAHALGVSATTVKALLRDGKLEAVHIGARRLFVPESVDRLIASMRAEQSRR